MSQICGCVSGHRRSVFKIHPVLVTVSISSLASARFCHMITTFNHILFDVQLLIRFHLLQLCIGGLGLFIAEHCRDLYGGHVSTEE